MSIMGCRRGLTATGGWSGYMEWSVCRWEKERMTAVFGRVAYTMHSEEVVLEAEI